MQSKSFVVVGGGIVGSSIALELAKTGRRVTLIEKEGGLAAHQTGRNSGVIHAGPYYKPGSLKAQLCTEGNRSMVKFAEEHEIPFEVTGKLLLGTRATDVERLTAIAERAAANKVDAELIGPEQIRELEPFASGLSALHVKSTGIIDYGAVTRKLAELSQLNGAEVLLNAEVLGITSSSNEVIVEHAHGVSRGAMLVNAAGLHSDRIATMAGVEPSLRIIPFRGEYFELSEEASKKVQGLIYPVPNPALPFLGVHLTKMIGGGVHAGPNAVLALAREGYSWGTINLQDVWSTLSYRGFARLATQNLSTGIHEVIRSLSPSLFARDLSKLVPGIGPKDLIRADAGVRAQAVGKDGKLVDDFVIQRTRNQVHILNAPSPAATASLAIARHIVRSLEQD
jgi:L-2-hydroxyglutarate oxidase